MAKLSAHGTEVARLDVTRTMPEIEYRVIYSFRSDGHIMRRLAIGSDGWKLYKRLKDPKRDTAARMRNLADQYLASHEARSESTINSFT